MLVQKKTRSILTPSNGRARVPSEAAHTPARDVPLSSLVGDRERRSGPHRRWGGRILGGPRRARGGPRRARRSPGRRSRARRERSADSVGTETVAETSPRSGKTALAEATVGRAGHRRPRARRHVTAATRAGEVALARRPRHGVCPAGAGSPCTRSCSRGWHRGCTQGTAAGLGGATQQKTGAPGLRGRSRNTAAARENAARAPHLSPPPRGLTVSAVLGPLHGRERKTRPKLCPPEGRAFCGQHAKSE